MSPLVRRKIAWKSGLFHCNLSTCSHCGSPQPRFMAGKSLGASGATGQGALLRTWPAVNRQERQAAHTLHFSTQSCCNLIYNKIWIRLSRRASVFCKSWLMIISTTRRSTKHHLKAVKLLTKSLLTNHVVSSACIVDRGQRRGPIVARWLSQLTLRNMSEVQF
jgi:hypothetical protein